MANLLTNHHVRLIYQQHFQRQMHMINNSKKLQLDIALEERTSLWKFILKSLKVQTDTLKPYS
jgi:hypothetical protein